MRSTIRPWSKSSARDVHPYDKEFVRKDGTRVPVLLGAAWLSEQNVGVAYFLDITDRKRQEEAIRRQTRILRSILDSIGDGVVVADEDGNFVLFNPAAEQILRLGMTDTRPENWSERYSIYQQDGETLFPVGKLPLVRRCCTAKKSTKSRCTSITTGFPRDSGSV